MPTRKAWYVNDHEGKGLRKIYNRLMNRFEKLAKDENCPIDDLRSLAHIIALVSKTKADLSKLDYYDKKMEMVMELLDQHKLKKIIPEYREDAKQLPGQTD